LRAESSLRESAEKMQGLTRRVIGAQEAERRRVASELHDELGQALTAIKINLQSGGRFKQRSPEALAHENIRIVDDALQQMRRLALALRPSILDNLGLTPALHWLGKQSALRAEFQFDFMPVQFSTRLASELETTCFRIVQEALTNTVRHAQARNVTVAMRLADDHVVISVHDDGVGFDAVEAQARSRLGQSFGVLGMLERAALVGGTLEVVSELGRGCTLTLRCPLQIQTEMT
jgi:signal transduction histidine kinase